MRTLFLLALAARAEVPMAPTPDCAESALDRCAPDLAEDDWDQVSWVPASSKASVRPEELAIGSGVAMDRAFRTTTGRFDVPIAVIDSGILWGAVNRKILLHPGELPYPRSVPGVDGRTDDVDGN